MGWSTAWLPPHTTTIAGAMRATGFSRRTIQNLFRSGLLARIKFGGRVLVLRADVERLVRHVGTFNGKRSLDPAAGPRRLRGPMTGRDATIPELNADLCRAEVIEILQRLPLRTCDSFCEIRLDREARNFLVTVLRGR
jgi:hypothetical protein